jgi:hypothetical protein
VQERRLRCNFPRKVSHAISRTAWGKRRQPYVYQGERRVSPFSVFLSLDQEDLIIPHVSPPRLSYLLSQALLQHYTFYDFIINKARGKSGPLFNFDVHDDVRLLADATKEKDESHAGKVVERSWYQRNKHIFPASRWEVCIFDYQIPFSYITSVSSGFRSRKELWKVHKCMISCVVFCL